ncbi:PP2C family protein-serine/threonine phosphatase [Nocardioides cynanchi]|uniref:PP2C family protein-serine/threonine phosphatase n=1 Tax=Nocardioides cynanchi TaxID=2558918 RepID=UPI001247EAE9|nr:SpoIIE family protein phosphatase [Nocardioides cynanchi]
MPGRERARRAFDAALLEHDAEQLYQQAPCGYLSLSADGLVVRVNQTFLTWTGFTRDALEGRRRFSELLTVGGRIYYETHFAPMIQLQGGAREIALEVVGADGVALPVLVNAVLERDADGAPRSILVAVFDASERRGYEQELLRARRTAEESETRALSLARTLQQTLIPPRPPDIPGLEVAAVYRPAGDGHEVGGDFYDVFQVAVDDWVVVLGDVSGKGVDAAVVTSLIRHSLRGIAVTVADPSEALGELNTILLADATDRFCTVLMLRLVRSDGSWCLTASAGGHPAALIWPEGASPGAVGEPGSLVGIFDDASFTTARVELGPGDTVVLYTDGLSEARRGQEFFSDTRLLERLVHHGADPAVLTRGLLEDALAFEEGAPRDDIAVLGLRVPHPHE